METEKTDIVIVGTGASGLFAALHLPQDKQILMITKDEVENSDSFLAQGGICVLHDKDDYDSFMEDTLKAGHYENRRESVDIMIRSSTNSSATASILPARPTVRSTTRGKAAIRGPASCSMKILRARKSRAIS